MYNYVIIPSQLKEECIICFYPLSNEKIAQVNCGHIYHHKCIKKWLKIGKTKKCPTCNTGDHIFYKSSLFCCFRKKPMVNIHLDS
uniref:RING-type domain-containing protein n=1 Tax=viral metagenome TaxID=1070528 RepID=A0A6C0LX98_9ZZZZ